MSNLRELEENDRVTSFTDIVALAENSIARKKDQVKEEIAGFAAALGLQGDDLARTVRYESSFWLDQAQRAGIEEGGIKDGEYWDNEYWRGFPEQMGARMRCIDALVELTVFLRDGFAAYDSRSQLECARMMDRLLDILRTEISKAQPPARSIYRAWMNREKLKERIEKLEERLELLEVPCIIEGPAQRPAQIEQR